MATIYSVSDSAAYLKIKYISVWNHTGILGVLGDKLREDDLDCDVDGTILLDGSYSDEAMI